MKRTIYLACFLAIFSMLAGCLLWFVNDLTYDRIHNAAIEAEKKNLVKIYPNGDFSDFEFTDETGLIEKVFEAKGEGYVYKVNVKGYKDTITFMIGINNDASIKGYEVLEIADTPGIGDRVVDELKSNVVGKTTTDSIDTLAGATVSSSAVVKGINAATEHFNELNDITGGTEKPPVVEEPGIKTGDKVKLDDPVLDTYEGSIIEELEMSEADTKGYVVEVKGYGLGFLEDTSYKPNQYKIIVNTATKTIISIENVSFGDTPGIGDKTNDPAYWELFSGLELSDSLEVDTVAGATYTSYSMISAVRIVLDALGK